MIHTLSLISERWHGNKHTVNDETKHHLILFSYRPTILQCIQQSTHKTKKIFSPQMPKYIKRNEQKKKEICSKLSFLYLVLTVQHTRTGEFNVRACSFFFKAKLTENTEKDFMPVVLV